MPHTPASIARIGKVDAVATAIRDHYDVEGRIEDAQYMEFEEGILVANEVAAEFLADLHLLMDCHGQDFDQLLIAAQAKYEAHKEAVES